MGTETAEDSILYPLVQALKSLKPRMGTETQSCCVVFLSCCIKIIKTPYGDGNHNYLVVKEAQKN